MHARRHQVRRHDGGRPADRAGRVDAEHRLAHRAERRRQVELGHHDALEHVGGLADDDGVDVGEGQAGVLERGHRGLAHQAGDGDVLPLGLGHRLADPDDRAALRHHTPSRTQTRFCCRHGPEVACATARSAWPDQMARADSPMRMSPADIIGLAASAPPEGLTADAVAQPERLGEDQLLVGVGRVQLGHVDLLRPHPGLLARQLGRRRRGEVPGADRVRLDPVVDAR